MSNTKPFILRKPVLIPLIILLALLLIVFAVVFPIVSVSVYDSIFKIRIQTPEHVVFTAYDYEGLHSETVSFTAKQGHNLVGYKYTHDNVEAPRGVAILVHGFGGGGHCGYMPVIEYVARSGYAVFSYDATGNDASEGEYVGGFPQGVMDLDYAINYVKADPDYAGLPIVLIGHSWGAYSIGNVLNFQTDIRAAVLFAGFNESKLLIRQTGLSYVGGLVDLMVPYVQAYEWFKFGKYAPTSANEGFSAAENCKVLVVHSKDDGTVWAESGYDLFYEAHGDNDRVSFTLYETRGHDDLFYSEDTIAYRREVNDAYYTYIEENGLEDNNASRAAYRRDCIDYSEYYKLDDGIMGQVIALFDAATAE